VADQASGEAMTKAKKPVLYVGGVIFSGASQELMELAELTHMPVDMTLMGLGLFLASIPINGMLGCMAPIGRIWLCTIPILSWPLGTV